MEDLREGMYVVGTLKSGEEVVGVTIPLGTASTGLSFVTKLKGECGSCAIRDLQSYTIITPEL